MKGTCGGREEERAGRHVHALAWAPSIAPSPLRLPARLLWSCLLLRCIHLRGRALPSSKRQPETGVCGRARGRPQRRAGRSAHTPVSAAAAAAAAGPGPLLHNIHALSLSLSLSIPQKSTVRCCVCNLTLAFLVSISLSPTRTLSLLSRGPRAVHGLFLSLPFCYACFSISLLLALNVLHPLPPVAANRAEESLLALLCRGGDGDPPISSLLLPASAAAFIHYTTIKKIKHIPSTSPLRTARR